MYQENPGDHAAGGAAKVLQVSVILYALMPKTLGPEYRGSAFGLFSWWQDCISVQGYTSVFSTVAAPLAALSSLLSSKESCVVCLSPVEPENAVSMRLGTP